MKLIYRILLRLSLALLAVLTVWTVFFYFTMIDEINDEVDDALEDYSETIIIRSLAGKIEQDVVFFLEKFQFLVVNEYPETIWFDP